MWIRSQKDLLGASPLSRGSDRDECARTKTDRKIIEDKSATIGVKSIMKLSAAYDAESETERRT
jgi:hypothetical protein